MFKKIRNFLQYVMFAIALIQAIRGWYGLTKDTIVYLATRKK